jgi:hypothetical protein
VNVTLPEMAPDQFDDVHRQSIARHSSAFAIQKRRIEIPNRRIRDRQLADARPGPCNDNVIKPLVMCKAETTEGYIEAVAVSVAAVRAPMSPAPNATQQC